MSVLEGLVLPEATPAKIITCTIEGALEMEDIVALTSISAPSENRLAGTETELIAGDIKKVREKHHMAARLLASGLDQGIVAKITGYTEGYFSTLLKAPAMVELVGFYGAKYENAAEVIHAKLTGAGLAALEKLVEKLDADELTENGLLNLSKLGLDRGGFGPTSTQQVRQVNHIVDHAELQRVAKEARKGSSEYIVRETGLTALPAPEDSE